MSWLSAAGPLAGRAGRAEVRDDMGHRVQRPHAARFPLWVNSVTDLGHHPPAGGRAARHRPRASPGGQTAQGPRVRALCAAFPSRSPRCLR